MVRVAAGVLLVFIYAAVAQEAESPEFEAASVKPAKPSPDGRITVGCKGGPGTADPGLYTCTNINLANFVGMAFRLNSYQMANPDYGDRMMYDITAKVPAGTTKEQFSLMLQKLVIQRFKLTYHYEKKEIATYQLVIAKGGIRMKESPPDPPADANTDPSAAPRGRGGMSMGPSGAKWTAYGIGTDRIAGQLAGQMGGPVIDATGIKGKYDFVLTWNPRSRNAVVSDDNAGPTLEEAIQDQLGLKLEAKKGSVDVFVIDHAERTAIEN